MKMIMVSEQGSVLFMGVTMCETYDMCNCVNTVNTYLACLAGNTQQSSNSYHADCSTK